MSSNPQKLNIPVCRMQDTSTVARSVTSENGAVEDKKVLSGHFSIFDHPYEINSSWEGRFIERIAPGAFKKTLAENGKNIRVTLEHGQSDLGDRPLGVPTRMEEDDHGAAYDVDLFDTHYVRELLPALETGQYSSSFRFQVVKDKWDDKPQRSDKNPDRIPERTILEARVFEFGPVSFPANDAATAGIRSSTDDYYERLRSRQPDAYEAAIRSLPQNPRLTEDNESPASTSETEAAPEQEEREAQVPASTPVETVTAEKKPEPREHSATPTSTTPKRSNPTMGEYRSAEERSSRLEEIAERMKEIGADYINADMPADVEAEFDALQSERSEHRAAIDKIEARRAVLKELVNDPTRSSWREAGAEQPVQPAPSVRKSTDIYDVDGLRRDSSNVDEFRARLRDNAMRAVESERGFGGVRREDAQSNVENLLHTVDNADGDIARRILATGSPVYQRAFGKAAMALNTNGLTSEERAALAVGADATGGYAVPFTLDPSVILTNNGSVNPLRQLARNIQISNKSWQGVTSAGITVTRSAEAAEANESEPTLAGPEVTPQRVTGFIKYSHEVDMDWSAMKSEMAMMLADARDQEEATSFTSGTGTPPAASGLVKTLNASSHVLTAGNLSIAAADVYALEEALPPRFRGRASAMSNRAIFNKIRQFDTNGGAQMWERIGAGMPSQLLGYNAYENSAMASTLAEDDLILLMGDFSQFVIVDRVGMTVELVPHLVGSNRIPTAQRGLLAVWRNNSKVLVDNAFRALKVKDA